MDYDEEDGTQNLLSDISDERSNVISLIFFH